MKTIVLGAGLAGLSAADELARHGMDVVIIEKLPYPGGLAASVRERGFRFDLGPHRFHTTNGTILKFIRDLPGIELMELQRLSRIRLLDRYFLYPLSLGDMISQMPVHRWVSTMADFFFEKIRGIVSPREQNSFEGWVLSRFGKGIYELFLAPYNRKLWGLEPSGLSADWASQRLTVPGLADLVRATFSPSKEKVRSLVSTFHYPRGGIGEISLALEKRIKSSGGSFIYGSEPLSIRMNDSVWNVVLKNGTINCDKIISTIPVTSYIDLLGDILPAEVHRRASRLKFRSLIFLAVLVKSDKLPRDHWIYTPEDRYPFNRVSIPGNFDPDLPSQVVFEFSCNKDDPFWKMPEDELLQATIPGAEYLGIFSSSDITGSYFYRAAHAYPIYDLEYAENKDFVLDALEKIPASVTCGRQGLFRYNNMDHSLEMGRYAALETLGEDTGRKHDVC